MHNYEAAVFSQASREMATLVAFLGGDPQTALGLPGVGDLNVTCNGGRTSRLGRWFGLGLNRDDAIEAMQGATLESVDVLEILDAALAEFRRRGELKPADLPLLTHLTDIVVRGAGLDVPFDNFSDTSISSSVPNGRPTQEVQQ
jgi:glycerol-3-phosphate dehydrogenase (NAD(P)+)